MINILRKDLKEILSHKKIWFTLIVVLIGFVISTTIATNTYKPKENTTNNITIGLLDLDKSMYSKLFLQFFEENEAYASYIKVVTGTKEELDEMIGNKQLDMYLIVPENFAEHMIQIQNDSIHVVINAADATKAIIIKNLLEGYEKYIAAVEINCVALYDIMEKSGMSQDLIDEKNVEVSYDLVFTALGKNNFFQEIFVSNMNTVPLVEHYVYEAVFLIIAYISVLIGIRMLQEEQAGILKRMLVTGSSMTAMVVGKIIVYAGICELFLVSTNIGIHFAAHHALSVQGLIFVSMILWCFCAVCVLLSSIIKNISNYLLTMNMLILFGTILGGGVIPASYLPDVLKMISKKLPNSWFRKEIIRLNSQGTNLKESTIIILLLVFIVSVIGASALYRRREVRENESL